MERMANGFSVAAVSLADLNGDLADRNRASNLAQGTQPDWGWEPPQLHTAPKFRQHHWIRGGHLQTLLALRLPAESHLQPRLHWVELADGDRIALHDDCPPQWRAGDPSLLIAHGLSGDRNSPYMLRMAPHFNRLGVRVFRLEMRGCGLARQTCRGVTHAGRSLDCLAALSHIAEETQAGPMWAVGVSLGGNQLLRAAGQLGSGDLPLPDWFDRWTRLMAVSPPIDLRRCSEHFQRVRLRPYNHFFIRNLLQSLPDWAHDSQDLSPRFARPWPKTLRELDDRITAPLSGFRDAMDYYQQASSAPLIPEIRVPTLILASTDDPLIPADCYHDLQRQLDTEPGHPVRMLLTRRGGHVGFIARGNSRHYMDQVVYWWMAAQTA